MLAATRHVEYFENEILFFFAYAAEHLSLQEGKNVNIGFETRRFI